jgi:hypothetical protein
MDAAHKMRDHTITAEPLVHNPLGLGQASGTRELAGTRFEAAG